MGHVGPTNRQKCSVPLCPYANIRDTDSHYYSAYGATDIAGAISAMDVSGFKTITIIMKNTQDQPMQFQLLNINSLPPTSFVLTAFTLPAGNVTLQETSLTFDIEKSGIQRILIVTTYVVAPTVGSQQIVLLGIPK